MGSDKTSTIQELKDLVEKFRQERNWGKHHSPKNLAISIAIEAAELMEHYQWDNYQEEDKSGVESELADILIYCIYFAVSNGIDISETVRAKIDKISKKYPVTIFNDSQDDPKDYWRIKKGYRSGGSQQQGKLPKTEQQEVI